MTTQDWRFYGFVGGCLLAAAVLCALLVGGEVGGTRVAELPQGHHGNVHSNLP
jgi:hypothetical protein